MRFEPVVSDLADIEAQVEPLRSFDVRKLAPPKHLDCIGQEDKCKAETETTS